MFNIDSFLAGEQGIEIYTQNSFRSFCAWATRHNLTWRNGADPMSEALHEVEDNYTLVNENNVRRYVGNRCNVYVMIDGHLSQRQRCYALHNNIERISFDNIPDDTLVDENGFEVETL